MSPSSFEKAIRLQFDCLIRKVIDRTIKNYYRELGRRAKHEVPFCDVTEADLNHVAIIDEYSMGYTVFLKYYQRKIYGGLEKWNVYKNAHDFQLSVQR